MSIYLSALSSGLVAIGFSSTSHRALESLGRLAAPYFEPDESVTGRHGVRYGRWSYLFTMASMVIVVNSVVGGATVALVFALAIKVAAPLPVVLGIVTGLALLAASLGYEHRRLTPVVLGSR